MTRAASKYDIMTSRLVFETFGLILFETIEEKAKGEEKGLSVKEIAEATKRSRGVVSEQIRTLKHHRLVIEHVEGKDKYFAVDLKELARFLKPKDLKSFGLFIQVGAPFAKTFEQLIELASRFEWKEKRPPSLGQVVEKFLFKKP